VDFSAFKRELVTHILTMADNPGFVDYARARVKELMEQEPALFVDLPDLLKAEMQKRKEPCSTTPTS
jgi:hypothetical protein